MKKILLYILLFISIQAFGLDRYTIDIKSDYKAHITEIELENVDPITSPKIRRVPVGTTGWDTDYDDKNYDYYTYDNKWYRNYNKSWYRWTGTGWLGIGNNSPKSIPKSELSTFYWGSTKFPGVPDDPMPEPVGEIPFFIMSLLCLGYITKKNLS